jgi:hypothetical protein
MKPYPFYKIALSLLLLFNCNLVLAEDQEEQLTVNATTTSVDDPSRKDIKEANKLADIFVLQKQLVYRLLQNIGLTPDKLSPDVKKAIDKYQTTNIKAFKAFSNCLDFQDKGLYEKAREQCDEAIRNDPNFVLAQRLRESIPDQRQTMSEIVTEHLNRSGTRGDVGSKPVVVVINNVPPNEPPISIVDPIDETCQTSGGDGCRVEEIDKSTPSCDKNGQCGFYSTFLAYSDSKTINVSSSPFINRLAVAIPPSNASGNIAINQLGYENKGHLNLQLDPLNQIGRVIGFQDAQANLSNQNFAPIGQLDRVVTHQFSTTTDTKGLELGAYLTRFDFNNTSTAAISNQQQANFSHGFLYFAEGSPTDTVKDLNKVTYSGVANGDFSVNGSLVPCQGTCGHFSSTLDYGSAKLDNFNLTADAKQTEGELTAHAEIRADNVGMRPTGEFQFDQSSGSFQVGRNQENLLPATGVVAGRPFGEHAELVGGVFAIHSKDIEGAGNFGGGIENNVGHVAR